LKAVHDQLGFRGDYEMSVGGGEKLWKGVLCNMKVNACDRL
jgi:hypothetical protein